MGTSPLKSSSRRRVTRALATALAALFTPPAAACPSYVTIKETSLGTGKRQELRLFALHAGDGAGARRWRSLPLQIDALDEQGVLREDAGDADGAAVAPLDRLVFSQALFGRKLEQDGAPCKADRAVELKDSKAERYAYLVVCDGDAPPAWPSPVSHDATIHKVVSTRYEYDYQPNNQLMYRRLYAKSRRWTDSLLAGADADLNLHLDVKNFFTMDFTNKDVESYVDRTYRGPMGMVGSIDFFLRLLFLKINLRMGTTVAFYDDAAHVPVTVEVPRDAPKLLQPGSGLLYTWINKDARFDPPGAAMLRADAGAALAGWEKSGERGLTGCADGGDVCTFSLRGGIGDERFALDINVPRAVVRRGFYPQWVDDVPAFKKAMGWDDEAKAPPQAVALFFDNSGLLAGQYRLDQWIRLGSDAELSGRCPRPVTVGAVHAFRSRP